MASSISMAENTSIPLACHFARLSKLWHAKPHLTTHLMKSDTTLQRNMHSAFLRGILVTRYHLIFFRRVASILIDGPYLSYIKSTSFGVE